MENMIDVAPLWITVGQAAGILIAGLLLLTLALWGSKQALKQGLDIWAVVRVHISDAREAVDEPTDALNIRLAKATGLPAEFWSSTLQAFIDTFAAGMTQFSSQMQVPVTGGETTFSKTPAQETFSAEGDADSPLRQ